MQKFTFTIETFPSLFQFQRPRETILENVIILLKFIQYKSYSARQVMFTWQIHLVSSQVWSIPKTQTAHTQNAHFCVSCVYRRGRTPEEMPAEVAMVAVSRPIQELP